MSVASPAAVAALVSSVCDGIPDAALRASIRARLESEAPSRLSGLLFSPSAARMGDYVALIRAAAGAPAGARVAPGALAALAFLYLAHAREWPLASAFVRAGGLDALGGLFSSPNLFLRGQALEAALQLTAGSPAFDYFAPDRAPGGEDAAGAAALHAAALGWAAPAERAGWGGAPVLRALSEAWAAGAPGVSENALRLLAWWLSYARLQHCAGAPLRCSRALLARLEEWAARPVGDNPPPVLEPVGGGRPALAGGPPLARTLAAFASPAGQPFSSAEEAKLARALADDFKRFPPADEGEVVSGLSPAARATAAAWRAERAATAARGPPAELLVMAAESGGGGGGGGGEGVLPPPGAPAPAPAVVDPDVAAAAAKDEGNAQFKQGRWAAASRAYSIGLAELSRAAAPPPAAADAPSPSSSAGGGGARVSVLAALHANRAHARLRMSGWGADAPPPAPLLLATRAMLDSLSAPAAAALAAALAGGDGGDGAAAAAAADYGGPGGSPAAAAAAAAVGPPALRGAPFELLCLLGACLDAGAALDAAPGHPKAGVRRAQALAGLHRFRAAAAAARGVLEAHAGVDEVVAFASALLDFVGPLAAAEADGGAAPGGRAGAGAGAGVGSASSVGVVGAGADAGTGKPEDELEDELLRALLQAPQRGAAGDAAHVSLEPAAAASAPAATASASLAAAAAAAASRGPTSLEDELLGTSSSSGGGGRGGGGGGGGATPVLALGGGRSAAAATATAGAGGRGGGKKSAFLSSLLSS